MSLSRERDDDVQCYYCGHWFARYTVGTYDKSQILICKTCKACGYDQIPKDRPKLREGK